MLSPISMPTLLAIPIFWIAKFLDDQILARGLAFAKFCTETFGKDAKTLVQHKEV